MEYLIIRSNDYSFIKNTIKSNIRTFLEKNINSDYVHDLLRYRDDDESTNESLDCLAKDMLDGFIGIFSSYNNENDHVYINYPEDEFSTLAVIENGENSFEWAFIPEYDWYWHRV